MGVVSNMEGIPYNTIASILLLLGIALLTVGVILYIKLDVYSINAELNGRATKRQLKRLKRSFKTSVTSNSTGSFYNNSLSSFTTITTGTTGSFGSGKYGGASGASGVLGGGTTQAHKGTAPLRVEDLGSLDQEEYKTGVFEEEQPIFHDADSRVSNQQPIVVLSEVSNVRF